VGTAGLFLSQGSRKAPFASRGVLCKTPSPVEVSGCLAGILGESRDSGRRLGLDALAVLDGVKEELLGIIVTWSSDSRSGLIMGDFVSGFVLRHEGRGAGKMDPPRGVT
jgi:hypothetical protein